MAAVLLLAQSVVAVIHNDAVLSRPDTRNLTRAWMVAHVPAGAKVVDRAGGPRQLGVRHRPRRCRRRRAARAGLCYPTWLTDVDIQRQTPLPPGQHAYVGVDQYERTLRPELLDEYAQAGYCWVVIGSLQAGRSFAQPKIAPQAIAYYAQLANHAKLVYHVSPFATRRIARSRSASTGRSTTTRASTRARGPR